MCCLFDLLVWLARPGLFANAFSHAWIWPILGIIFLPFTTLVYVLLRSSGSGLAGRDWPWLLLALVIDGSHWAGAAYTRRDRLPTLAAV